MRRGPSGLAVAMLGYIGLCMAVGVSFARLWREDWSLPVGIAVIMLAGPPLGGMMARRSQLARQVELLEAQRAERPLILDEMRKLSGLVVPPPPGGG